MLRAYSLFFMTFREQLIENIIKEYIMIYDLTPEQQHAILERIPSLSDTELMDEMRNITQYYSTVSQAYKVWFSTIMHEVEQENATNEKKDSDSLLLFL